MDTKAVLEALGFRQADCAGGPGYVYDFGNLRLEALETLSRRFQPAYLLSGVLKERNAIGIVEFDMPLEVDSFEQGVALIAYAIGRDFKPAIACSWLDDGRAWKEHLPWERERRAYEQCPKCTIEKELFRLTAKKLAKFAMSASETEVAWLSFDGEVLRISVCGELVIVQAAGRAWESRYAFKARHILNLPTRLRATVCVSVWKGNVSVGNRSWPVDQLHINDS